MERSKRRKQEWVKKPPQTEEFHVFTGPMGCTVLIDTVKSPRTHDDRPEAVLISPGGVYSPPLHSYRELRRELWFNGMRTIKDAKTLMYNPAEKPGKIVTLFNGAKELANKGLALARSRR